MSFVAVDWGSTRFRAYKVEPSGVSARITSHELAAVGRERRGRGGEGRRVSARLGGAALR